jgi:uncharacterized protein YjiS (DUF1127 family)
MTTLVERQFRDGAWTSHGGGWSSLVRALSTASQTIRAWRLRAATRRELSRLDDRLLKDIGITRAQAYREAVKPFWRS